MGRGETSAATFADSLTDVWPPLSVHFLNVYRLYGVALGGGSHGSIGLMTFPRNLAFLLLFFVLSCHTNRMCYSFLVLWRSALNE
jgi:hypothetical protein